MNRPRQRTANSLKTMLHLSISLYPREAGLIPHHVTFTREQSPPVKSMLDEGVIYHHPERQEKAIVYAKDEASISDVLNYHYRRSWNRLQVLKASVVPT
jgi:hypothetical protein